MKYRPLGTTGLTISEIGFGAWGIGGATPGATSYGKADDRTSLAALRTALEHGITFFDTADIYGGGHSEQLLGQAFGEKSGLRDKVVIASKVGFLGHNAPQNFSPDHIRTTLTGTLDRLASDYLDLYQLHGPALELVTDDVLGMLDSLKKEGLIRAYGISLRAPEDGAGAIDLGFRAIQANYNLIDQRIRDNGLLDDATAAGAGIIARTPLAFGFLTGRITSTTFASDDHRSAWPREQLERWNRAPKLFSPLNTGTSRTMTQLALQFCIADPAVATVIPGIMTPEEAVENASASDLPPLDAATLTKITDIYENNEFYDRRAVRSNLS